MLPSTHPFIQTLVLFDFVPLKSSFRDTLVALGVFFIKILKVLNSPHSFYFSSTLEGVKQPVCAPPLLGWNPALLQRCVSVCVCPHAFDGRARSSLWKPAGCSSDEKAHKRLPRRSHATQTVQSDLRVSESGDMEETDEGNTFAGVGEREWWELMGADGNGATVAELRLIAALDKESIW